MHAESLFAQQSIRLLELKFLVAHNFVMQFFLRFRESVCKCKACRLVSTFWSTLGLTFKPSLLINVKLPA